VKFDRLYLLHIEECLDSIADFTGGDKKKFSGSKLIRDAVLRNLQTLSEAATKLSAEFKSKHPEIEWAKVAGFRNVIVHNYLGIDPAKVWDVIVRELPGLRTTVANGLKDSSPKDPVSLRKEALGEAYDYFDRNIRALPRRPDGSIDQFSQDLHNTDVDAFRHAYVSGIFAREYGERIARMLGWMNELWNIGQPADEENMDFWNDALGRKYGLTSKTRKELLVALHQALARGDMITSPRDPRRFGEPVDFRLDQTRPVIVLSEELSGLNEVFFDLVTSKLMTRQEFVEAILTGSYPGYKVVTINGRQTPMSKADQSTGNNLD
jgi:uncharacterized protein with HEPN domain